MNTTPFISAQDKFTMHTATKLILILSITSLINACTQETENSTAPSEVDIIAAKQHQLDTQIEFLNQTKEVIKYVEEQDKLLEQALK